MFFPVKNIPNPLHNEDGKLVRQASIEAETTEMKADEGQHHEQRESESEKQHGGGSGQVHLPGDASDKGQRSNIGHQEEDSPYVCKLQQAQQDLACKKHQLEGKGNASQEASAFSGSLRL